MPPEVMLLHHNRLNADSIGAALGLFEWRRYKFVTLTEALSDNAYRTPDSYKTKFGPMWGCRWANPIRRRGCANTPASREAPHRRALC
jgi:hypothetical protein